MKWHVLTVRNVDTRCGRLGAITPMTACATGPIKPILDALAACTRYPDWQLALYEPVFPLGQFSRLATIFQRSGGEDPSPKTREKIRDGWG